ncbi:MAG: hypothetical protein WBA83_04200 [Burkholderiaceae bacterium]
MTITPSESGLPGTYAINPQRSSSWAAAFRPAVFEQAGICIDSRVGTGFRFRGKAAAPAIANTDDVCFYAVGADAAYANTEANAIANTGVNVAGENAGMNVASAGIGAGVVNAGVNAAGNTAGTNVAGTNTAGTNTAGTNENGSIASSNRPIHKTGCGDRI